MAHSTKAHSIVTLAMVLLVPMASAHAESSHSVPQDISQDACLSKKQIDESEKSNDLISLRRLAKHYAVCVEGSDKKVIELYERASQYGFSVDIWNLAGALDDAGENSRALLLYLDIAKRGSGDAARKVASAFLQGKGVARDFGQAANWYENDASRCKQNSAVDLAMALESLHEPNQYVRALAWLIAAKNFSSRNPGPGAASLEGRLRKSLTAQQAQLASTLASELTENCGVVRPD